MRISKFWGALLLGLVLGAAGGVYGTRRALWRLIPHQPDVPRITAKLTKELSLDAAQQGSLRKILEGYSEKVAAANKTASADRDALRESLRNEIRKVLRPDQLKVYEDRVAKADARRKAAAAYLWRGPS